MHRPIFACAIALLLVDCKKTPPPATSFTYDVYVESAGAIGALVVDGKSFESTSHSQRGADFEVTLPASDYLTEKSMTVTIATSCGDSAIAAKATVGISKADTRSSEDQERTLLTADFPHLTGHATFTAPPEATIWVDRAGSESTPIQIGTTTLDPKLPSSRVVLGACATSDQIKIGGVALGSLHLDAKDPKKPPMGFVDAAGGHCYEVVEHVYVDKTWDSENIDGGKIVRLEGQRGYATPIDDFLTPSPTELTTKDALSSRFEVRHCAPKLNHAPPPKRGH